MERPVRGGEPSERQAAPPPAQPEAISVASQVATQPQPVDGTRYESLGRSGGGATDDLAGYGTEANTERELSVRAPRSQRENLASGEMPGATREPAPRESARERTWEETDAASLAWNMPAESKLAELADSEGAAQERDFLSMDPDLNGPPNHAQGAETSGKKDVRFGLAGQKQIQAPNPAASPAPPQSAEGLLVAGTELHVANGRPAIGRVLTDELEGRNRERYMDVPAQEDTHMYSLSTAPDIHFESGSSSRGVASKEAKMEYDLDADLAAAPQSRSGATSSLNADPFGSDLSGSRDGWRSLHEEGVAQLSDADNYSYDLNSVNGGIVMDQPARTDGREFRVDPGPSVDLYAGGAYGEAATAGVAGESSRGEAASDGSSMTRGYDSFGDPIQLGAYVVEADKAMTEEFLMDAGAADSLAELEEIDLVAGKTVTAPASVEPAARSLSTADKSPVLGDIPVVGMLFKGVSNLDSSESLELRPVFLGYQVNPYRWVSQEPISTFSIDVDTASYTLARRYIQSGSRPPPDSIRTEEFVNFFEYDDAPPASRPFAIHVQGAPAPFGEGLLMRIGIKGKRLGRDDQKISVLTFVVDTSGSMDTEDRLGLVKTSLRLLIGELAPADRVALVQVDSDARLILEHTPVEQAAVILDAIDGLQCSGSTHLAAGIELGYDVATAGFVGGAVNRVLILSDGAANLGSADPDEILARVAAARKQGIVSSVFGFGLGTYNDAMLETLANRGDGAYHFIDTTNEAQRVFVDDLSAALHVIARDVKIQVEFDPARVAQYRQLGYENRQLKTEDFRNDSVDAGEVGSGQSVTALYELILAEETEGPLGSVRIRYRDEATGAIQEFSRALRAADMVASPEEAGARFQLAACVAEYAELLSHSPFASDGSFDEVAAALRPIAMEYHLDERVTELLQLVQRAASLPPHTP